MAHAQDDIELFQMQQGPKESAAMGPRTRPPKLWFVSIFNIPQVISRFGLASRLLHKYSQTLGVLNLSNRSRIFHGDLGGLG